MNTYRKRFGLSSLMLAAFMLICVLSGCSGETDSLNTVIGSGQLVFGISPDMEPFSFVLSEYPAGSYDAAGKTTEPVNGASDAGSTDDVSSGDASPSDSAASHTDIAAVQQSDDTVVEYTGLSIDLGSELTEMLNVTPVFVPVEQNEAVEALESDLIDCYLCLAAVDIKTASTMYTIDTGMDCRHIIVVPESSAITKLSELASHTLGCVSGSDTAAELSHASLIRSEVSQVIYYSDAGAMLKAVEAGDIDAVVINEPLFNYRKKDGFESLHSIGEVLAESDLVIAMNLRDDTLSERIELLYGMMSENGTIGRLREKWLIDQNP